MPETKRKTTRAEKIVRPGVYETTDKVAAPAKKRVTEQSLRAELADIAQKVLKPKKPAHRPSNYSNEIADEICWRLTHGEPLVRICADEHLPHVATIYRWLVRHAEFRDRYAQAREEQADTNADEILKIADEMPPEYTDDKGRTSLDHTYLAWQKQRIEARKWTAMKLKPKKYGDRMAVEGVEGGAAIKTEETSSGRLFEIIRNLELTKRAG
jgi:hypothetical protein